MIFFVNTYVLDLITIGDAVLKESVRNAKKIEVVLTYDIPGSSHFINAKPSHPLRTDATNKSSRFLCLAQIGLCFYAGQVTGRPGAPWLGLDKKYRCRQGWSIPRV